MVPCCKAMHTVSRCLRSVSPGPRNDDIAVEGCYWGIVGVRATETGKVGARRQLKPPFALVPTSRLSTPFLSYLPCGLDLPLTQPHFVLMKLCYSP